MQTNALSAHASSSASSYTALEESILRTLAWFAGFSYPLTAFEIWKWMLLPPPGTSLTQVLEVLEKSTVVRSAVAHLDGMYLLGNEESLGHAVRERQARFSDTARKLRKVRALSWFFTHIPWVRAVACCNTMGFWFTTEKSDIDLFVITRKGTVWLTRFLVVFPFWVTGQRPRVMDEEMVSEHKALQPRDPFCFSFFVDESALDLSSIKIPGGDPYLAYWCASLIPVVDKDHVLARFASENTWVTHVLPHVTEGLSSLTSEERKASSLSVLGASRPPSRLTRFFNQLTAFLQKRKLPVTVSTRANQDSRVVMSEQMIKIHVNDRRMFFRQRFVDRLQELCLDVNRVREC